MLVAVGAQWLQRLCPEPHCKRVGVLVTGLFYAQSVPPCPAKPRPLRAARTTTCTQPEPIWRLPHIQYHFDPMGAANPSRNGQACVMCSPAALKTYRTVGTTLPGHTRCSLPVGYDPVRRGGVAQSVPLSPSGSSVHRGPVEHWHAPAEGPPGFLPHSWYHFASATVVDSASRGQLRLPGQEPCRSTSHLSPGACAHSVPLCPSRGADCCAAITRTRQAPENAGYAAAGAVDEMRPKVGASVRVVADSGYRTSRWNGLCWKRLAPVLPRPAAQFVPPCLDSNRRDAA
jgi:hypothetical protein